MKRARQENFSDTLYNLFYSQGVENCIADTCVKYYLQFTVVVTQPYVSTKSRKYEEFF